MRKFFDSDWREVAPDQAVAAVDLEIADGRVVRSTMYFVEGAQMSQGAERPSPTEMIGDIVGEKVLAVLDNGDEQVVVYGYEDNDNGGHETRARTVAAADPAAADDAARQAEGGEAQEGEA
jgi:hypothetical protein